MSKWIKTIGWGFALFLLFVILTFPYERLSPLVRKGLELALSRGGIQSQCSVDGLSYHFPLGIAWEHLTCSQGTKPLFVWGAGSIVTLPGYQKMKTEVGKGAMEIKTNMGITASPTTLQGNFTNVPLNLSSFSRLLQAQSMKRGMGFSGQQVFMVLNDLKVDGVVNGSVDLPLTALHRKSGQIALELKGLKIPEQASLSLVGFKEIIFSKSVIKADLKSGKISMSDTEFVSPELTFKAEGGFELQEDLPRSVGPLTFKWKIAKSDAVMNAPLGAQIANQCPAGFDTQGFCNQRIQRLQELM